MTNLQEPKMTNVDELIAASAQFEKKLIEAGFSQAHDWMFNLREILYDLQRIKKDLADLFNASDANEAIPKLDNFVEDFLYGVVPHIQHHLTELEQEMESQLLETKA